MKKSNTTNEETLSSSDSPKVSYLNHNEKEKIKIFNLRKELSYLEEIAKMREELKTTETALSERLKNKVYKLSVTKINTLAEKVAETTGYKTKVSLEKINSTYLIAYLHIENVGPLGLTYKIPVLTGNTSFNESEYARVYPPTDTKIVSIVSTEDVLYISPFCPSLGAGDTVETNGGLRLCVGNIPQQTKVPITVKAITHILNPTEEEHLRTAYQTEIEDWEETKEYLEDHKEELIVPVINIS